MRGKDYISRGGKKTKQWNTCNTEERRKQARREEDQMGTGYICVNTCEPRTQEGELRKLEFEASLGNKGRLFQRNINKQNAK